MLLLTVLVAVKCGQYFRPLAFGGHVTPPALFEFLIARQFALQSNKHFHLNYDY